MFKYKYVLDPWSIIENKFDSSKMIDSESIFSLGNGKIGQRGNFEEDFSNNKTIGNYISGIYFRDKTKVGWWKKGYPDYFAKMVNCPNWNKIRITINNELLDLNKCEILFYKRELNMKEGWCERKALITTNNSIKIEIQSKKFISLKRENIGAINYKIKVFDNNIKVKVLPCIDINIRNNDSNWNEPFVTTINSISKNNFGIVNSRVINSEFEISTFFKTFYSINNKKIDANYIESNDKNLIGCSSEFLLNKNDELTLLKVGGYVNSNDSEKKSFNDIIKKECDNALKVGFFDLCKENIEEWNKIWEDSDIIINGDVKSQQAIRFNIFQLNQTFNGNDPNLNIGPKGFTGEKYGGVTYWDTEAYCVPFYLGTKHSDVAKNLLNQRYNQLKNAIKNAEKIGLNHGAALYPMVTVNGEECHNEWEITFEEIHRNAAIAQAIKKYITFTDDFEFLENKGIKILIAISRFWEQRVNFSSLLNKYVILGVTGPNEYENNIDNNWYTNYSAKWCLEYTIYQLSEITKRSKRSNEFLYKENGLSRNEISSWKKIIENIHLPYSKDLNVFIQNDGFLNKDLKPINNIPQSQRPINQNWSWDRILRSPYIKQADVLQGFYFFEDDFTKTELVSNFKFYEQFTVHESSLSACIHSILASRINNVDKAYDYYIRASRLDLDDYNKEIKQGLHITSMGGSWMSIVEGFAGLKVKNDKIYFDTKIPKKWESYSFKVNIKNRKIEIKIDQKSTSAKLISGDKINLIINDTDTILNK
ncbi:family 65 glycosyl hydrolase domain-containing protein [Flavobacteriaceae bacterium]|nr:family 65 glycosyl hydrolase domain-containing protein [Flavobacteriaceae bacterium]